MSYRGRPLVIVIDGSNPREEEGPPASETEIQVHFRIIALRMASSCRTVSEWNRVVFLEEFVLRPAVSTRRRNHKSLRQKLISRFSLNHRDRKTNFEELACFS